MHGRRKLLVEMATGTGKTRTAAAFIKRLFEAGTRHPRPVPRGPHRPRAARPRTPSPTICATIPVACCGPAAVFDREQAALRSRPLQTMIAEYRDLSPGYFDLVITDECHRSIYGKWSGVLRHFDGIQLGLTATPCTAPDADALARSRGRAVRAGHATFLRSRRRPTFRYTLRRGHRGGPSRSLSHLQGHDDQDRGLEDGFHRDVVTSSTGARWTRATRAEFEEAVRGIGHDNRGSARPGTEVHDSRAQPRHCPRIPRCASRRGSWARTASGAGPDHGAKPSCSRLPETSCGDAGGNVRRALRGQEAAPDRRATPISW